MEDLHIMLPDGMNNSIRKVARKRGISLSELVQDYFQKLISEDEEIAPEGRWLVYSKMAPKIIKGLKMSTLKNMISLNGVRLDHIKPLH